MRTRRAAGTVLLLSLCSAAGAVEIRSPLDDANALQQRINTVVEQSCGSVFAVTAFHDDTSDPGLYERFIPANLFLQIAERAQRSCGSAFAIDGDGYLLTNEHVVSGAKSVWVTTDKGDTLPALVIATDPRGDLAVLKIPLRTTPLKFANESVSQRGDLVVTIGNPGGMSITGVMAASVGNVSAVGRALPILAAREHRFYGDLLQITTPISTGSSGGPLLDLSGNVVGVVCAVVPNGPADQNIGFAIALSPTVKSRVECLKAGRETVYGYLGVNVSPAQSDDTGVSIVGARVDRIDPGTPAVDVLEVGDIVLRFDEKPVQTDIDFIRFAGACEIDRDVPLTVVRNGETLDLNIRPKRRVLPIEPVSHAAQRFTWAGVTFANDSEPGVAVVEVAEHVQSPLKSGQKIAAANGKAVPNLAALVDVLHSQAGKPLEIDVRTSKSNGMTQFSAEK